MKLSRALPNDYISTHNKLGFRVPLMVRYVVASLDPDPLLSLGQESVVWWSSLPCLHHCVKKKEVKDMCLLLGVHEVYVIGEVQTGLYMG